MFDKANLFGRKSLCYKQDGLKKQNNNKKINKQNSQKNKKSKNKQTTQPPKTLVNFKVQANT